MKNITRKLLPFFAFLFIAITAYSQDRIYLVDGKVMEGSLESIADREVLFMVEKDGVVEKHTFLKGDVLRIISEDGTVEEFLGAYKDPELYVGQLRRTIKFHLFSPLLGHTGFSYEKSLRAGRGIEFTAGIIGLGNNPKLGQVYEEGVFRRDVKVDPTGLYLGVGYKYFSKPVVRVSGMRYKHLLQGWYFMPKLLVGYYKENTLERIGNFGSNVLKRRSVGFMGLMAYAGKQVVFSGTYLLEWHVGMGLGIDGSEDSTHHHYIVTMGGNNAMLGGGVRLGILF